MIGASKILTVSYGTFSCTLEGFDEPFNTMKAIAEYFRDLAAEDRYFGAEPPTPDAAMLHRIAEREIQRRVEAKIQDNGVILRAGDAEATALAAPQPAPSVSAAPLADASGETVAARLSRLRAAQAAAPLPIAEEPAFAEPAAFETAEPETAEPETAVDLAAAELATDFAAEPLAAAPADDIAEDIAEDFIAAELISQDALPEAYDEAYEDADVTGSYDEDQHAEDILASLSDLPAAEAEDFSDLNDPALDELIAAEVSAIKAADQAAPAQADATAEPAGYDTAFDADFDAGFEDSADESLLADLLPEDTAAPEADDLPEAAAAISDDDMLASVGALIANTDQSAKAEPIDTLIDDFDEEEDAQIEASYAADPGFEDDEDDTAEMLARMETTSTAPVAAPVAEVTPEPEPTPEPAAEAVAEAAVSAVGERLQRARARVIKIRRADAPPAPVAAPAPQTSLLSAEAEAALQAELAALEAESTADLPAAAVAAPRPVRPVRPLAPQPAEPAPDSAPAAAAAAAADEDQRLHAAINAAIPPSPVAADLPAPAATAESRRILEANSQDDAVNRLIAHTNSEMDDEANRRRHAAISHLKAAVAATEAERQINAAHPGKPPVDPQNAYRSDLQNVVRPPAADQRPADQRPAAERPSPLVLVSELRIDRKPGVTPTTVPTLATTTAEAAPRVVMPVRPRRVSATLAAVQAEDTLLGNADDDFEDEDSIETEAEVNLFAEGNSFADFAEKLGASSLSDLLEASAVYCAQVLGRPQFTRTIVMRQLETLNDAPDHSREDSLRVFGTLLRQGRITKIKRGQFAVTDRSPLLAEALRNAG